MLKDKLLDIRNKIELYIEELRIEDPLMIFPWHVKIKAKWERQNIKNDIKKLRKSKQENRRKNNARIKRTN